MQSGWTRTFVKASLIYRKTKNLRAVQLLLGIEIDDALEVAEQTELCAGEERWTPSFGQVGSRFKVESAVHHMLPD